MDPVLETKLAGIMQYLMQVEFHKRSKDSVGLRSYLDDADIAEWVDRMDREGRIKTTRFLRSDGR